MSFFDNKDSDKHTRIIPKDNHTKVIPKAGAVPPTEKIVTGSSSPTEKIESISGAGFREVQGQYNGSNEPHNRESEAEKTGPLHPTPQSEQRKSTGPKTVVFRPGTPEISPELSEKAETASSSKLTSSEPVIGWLVIVKGPGRGIAVEFSYGLQRIGRDKSQSISLDYGDSGISRENHAAIEYDPKSRQFFLSKGDNLVYLNGSRVGQGQECELSIGDEITLGANNDSTVLKFTPFCGTEFCWSDI